MNKVPFLLLFLILIFGCKTAVNTSTDLQKEASFTLAFGSCNKHDLQNHLWDDILESQPDVWIWGGDNIYADTDDVTVIASMYDAQRKVSGYEKLRSEVPVIGTWDDHDYGLNDGGVEWEIKKASQQAFLNFLDVPIDDPLRAQEGIYAAHEYSLPQGQLKIITLDTRYFRTALTEDPSGQKRYVPNSSTEGTILGEAQWKWLENELGNSTAEFNILVSSIQFLSDQHGFECWGNFPGEVARMKKLLVDSNAKGIIMLSGDRHISEFSSTKLEGLPFPLVDFTSSGLTHVYSNYSGEPNPYRNGEVISQLSFGILKLNFVSRKAHFRIMGDEGKVLAEFEQQY